MVNSITSMQQLEIIQINSIPIYGWDQTFLTNFWIWLNRGLICGFDILDMKYPRLLRKSHRAIEPTERLVITIRYLATGSSFHTLSYSFRLSVYTVSKIVEETCDAIYDCLLPIYLKTPKTPEEWKKVSAEFWDRWQVANVCGMYIYFIFDQKIFLI